MGDKTGIEWTDATWNPTTGCSKVSPGCENCYAIRVGARLQHTDAYEGTVDDDDWTGRLNLVTDRLDQPLRWKRPRRIFVNSMSDLFHPNVPDEFIARVWAVMERASQHTFQILTKRPQRMQELLSSREFVVMMDEWRGPEAGDFLYPLLNVWLGTSIESDTYAFRARYLRDTPAAIRFLSLEPLVGAIPSLRFDKVCSDCGGKGVLPGLNRSSAQKVGPPNCYHCNGQGTVDGAIDWVIVGGESGPNARPMHPDWARSLRDRCVEAGVAFHFKQWGEYLPVPLEDDPEFSGGRAYEDPRGGRIAAVIRERSQKAFTTGRIRGLKAGEVRRDGTQLLDENTVAVRVGKREAGRTLDGRTWDEYPD